MSALGFNFVILNVLLIAIVVVCFQYGTGTGSAFQYGRAVGGKQCALVAQ